MITTYLHLCAMGCLLPTSRMLWGLLGLPGSSSLDGHCFWVEHAGYYGLADQHVGDASLGRVGRCCYLPWLLKWKGESLSAHCAGRFTGWAAGLDLQPIQVW